MIDHFVFLIKEYIEYHSYKPQPRPKGRKGWARPEVDWQEDIWNFPDGSLKITNAA